MSTRPLLRNVRYRVMATPVSPLHTRLIRIRPSSWAIYRSFEIILEWKLFIDWNSNPRFYANPVLQKHSVLYFKTFNCRGQLGL